MSFYVDNINEMKNSFKQINYKVFSLNGMTILFKQLPKCYSVKVNMSM